MLMTLFAREAGNATRAPNELHLWSKFDIIRNSKCDKFSIISRLFFSSLLSLNVSNSLVDSKEFISSLRQCARSRLLLTRARYCRHRSRLDATKRLHHNTQRIHEQKSLVNSCEASIPHLIAVLHIAPSRRGVSLLCSTPDRIELLSLLGESFFFLFSFFFCRELEETGGMEKFLFSLVFNLCESFLSASNWHEEGVNFHEESGKSFF